MKSLKVIFGMYAVVITLVLANAAMALEDSKPDELKNKKTMSSRTRVYY
jgi:hypothetical protein